jgi:mono/diheme cytochrome c family protein
VKFEGSEMPSNSEVRINRRRVQGPLLPCLGWMVNTGVSREHARTTPVPRQLSAPMLAYHDGVRLLESVSTGFDLKTSQLTIAACALFFVLAVAFAETPLPDSTLTANPVFQKNCAKCHGKTAAGRHFGGPSLMFGQIIAASTDHLRTIITSGEGRMPKYAGKLTAEEIDTLVRQIEALNRR